MKRTKEGGSLPSQCDDFTPMQDQIKRVFGPRVDVRQLYDGKFEIFAPDPIAPRSLGVGNTFDQAFCRALSTGVSV